MKIITHSSKLTEIQIHTFNQGASYILASGSMQLGVWTENTPILLGVPVITIGACDFKGNNSAHFLKSCVKYIRKNHPQSPIIGPMNGNTWMKHRLIIKTDHRAPFLMEPVDDGSLLETFQSSGFDPLSSYSSSIIDLSLPQTEFHRIERIVAKQNIQIRKVDIDHFEQDLNDIYNLCLSAFSNNFLYTPLPKDSFMNSYLSSKDQIDDDFVLLAYQGHTLIGFLFCLPDINPDTLIAKTLATCPHHRTAGLGTLLVAKAHQRAKEKGYLEVIHALQYENNSSVRISQRFSAIKFRTYGLMITS